MTLVTSWNSMDALERLTKTCIKQKIVNYTYTTPIVEYRVEAIYTLKYLKEKRQK